MPTTANETEALVDTLSNTLSEIPGNNTLEITALNRISINNTSTAKT